MLPQLVIHDAPMSDTNVRGLELIHSWVPTSSGARGPSATFAGGTYTGVVSSPGVGVLVSTEVETLTCSCSLPVSCELGAVGGSAELSPQATAITRMNRDAHNNNWIVVTHASTMSFWAGMTVEDMKALAAMGTFLEHCVAGDDTHDLKDARVGVGRYDSGHRPRALHKQHQLWASLPSNSP